MFATNQVAKMKESPTVLQFFSVERVLKHLLDPSMLSVIERICSVGNNGEF